MVVDIAFRLCFPFGEDTCHVVDAFTSVALTCWNGRSVAGFFFYLHQIISMYSQFPGNFLFPTFSHFLVNF